MEKMRSMQSVAVLAVLLVMSVLFAPVASAREVGESYTVYFSNLPPSEGVNAVRFTNLPPAQEYKLVTANPLLFAADADSGKPVAVSLLGKEYLLDLKSVPAPIAEDAKCILVDESGTFTTGVPLIKCYAGTVSGDPESYAFFTVDNEVILGTVRTGNLSYVIDQVGIVEAGSKRQIVHAIYDGSSVADIKEPLAYGAEVPLRRDLSEIAVQLPGGVFDVESGITSTTTVTLMAAHDYQFRNLFPSPNTEMTNMVAQINTALSPSDIGVSLQISAYCDLGTTLAAYNHESLLREFSAENAAFRDSTNSDIAVLFTGRDLDNEYIGASYVYVPDPDGGYAHAQMCSSGGSYQATFSHRCINAAHEIGHLFGAGHEDSTAPYPSYAKAYHWTEWFVYNRYTALWSSFMGNDMCLEYSCDTRHGDASHDNARRISETKGIVTGYQ